MKKLILTLILISSFGFCFASDGEVVEVPMTSNPTHNRNLVTTPDVSYSSDGNSLIIEFDAEVPYVLEITDENENIWYSGSIICNGAPHSYYIGLQAGHTYTITISSASNSYYGILVL